MINIICAFASTVCFSGFSLLTFVVHHQPSPGPGRVFIYTLYCFGDIYTKAVEEVIQIFILFRNI